MRGRCAVKLQGFRIYPPRFHASAVAFLCVFAALREIALSLLFFAFPGATISSRMKIILLRHGKPEMPRCGRVTALEMQEWIRSYNAAGIDREHPAPAGTVKAACDCAAVVCSDLPRSIQSAHVLNVERINYSDALFRETDLPFANWNSLRLSPYAWAALFRALWLFGRTGSGESYVSARFRSVACAEKLARLASTHGSVLLVGHGLINHFIAKELLSKGWRGPSNPGKRHWSFGVYVRG